MNDVWSKCQRCGVECDSTPLCFFCLADDHTAAVADSDAIKARQQARQQDEEQRHSNERQRAAFNRSTRPSALPTAPPRSKAPQRRVPWVDEDH